MPPDPDPGPRFDPTDPADLEQLCAHLLRRSGRAFVVLTPFQVPVDPDDPAAESVPYPAHPSVRHSDPGNRLAVFVSFPADDSFRISGWVRQGDPPAIRAFNRTGRYHRCGPAELGDGLAAVLHKLLAN